MKDYEKNLRLKNGYTEQEIKEIESQEPQEPQQEKNLSFNCGMIVCTRQIDQDMKKNENFKTFIIKSLLRHLSCDFGELYEEDKKMNIEALNPKEPERILSKYIYMKDTEQQEEIYIITEWDRSATTILYTYEY